MAMAPVSAVLAVLLSTRTALPGSSDPFPGEEAGPPIFVPVAWNLDRLLAREDTDGDGKITARDGGPRRFEVRASDGRALLVEGAFRLSNLLQELVLARRDGRGEAVISLGVLFAPPPRRISRMIRQVYWDALTRRLDAEGIARALEDTKVAGSRRIYVPSSDPGSLRYYRDLARARPDLRLEVAELPAEVGPGLRADLRRRPGILALAMGRTAEGALEPLPFVVPGGRFNELYGWDSYFIVLGLLADGRVGLARSMVEHLVYEVERYGKVLNANRTYYLGRSQPPFLTAMALAVHALMDEGDGRREWLARALRAAVREYETVWTGPERLTPIGLSRYGGEGEGIPPETEPGHFDSVLRPFAERMGIGVGELARRYDAGEVRIPELDEYLRHDRAMRESGHDTTNRLVGRAARLAPVSLNALLYRYERDLAEAIEGPLGGKLILEGGRVETAAVWRERARERKRRIDLYLWDPEAGLYRDWDLASGRRTEAVSATAFYPLWAGAAGPEQARALAGAGLRLLEAPGGLLSGTRESRGPVGPDRPQRQWDYPFGWAPHQVLLWQGLRASGHEEAARRLAYRWLWTVSAVAAREGGAIVEKYDVAARTAEAAAEYGNVGAGFRYVPDGGFGWTDASFQVGLGILGPEERSLLDALVPPEWIHGAPEPSRTRRLRPGPGRGGGPRNPRARRSGTLKERGRLSTINYRLSTSPAGTHPNFQARPAAPRPRR